MVSRRRSLLLSLFSLFWLASVVLVGSAQEETSRTPEETWRLLVENYQTLASQVQSLNQRLATSRETSSEKARLIAELSAEIESLKTSLQTERERLKSEKQNSERERRVSAGLRADLQTSIDSNARAQRRISDLLRLAEDLQTQLSTASDSFESSADNLDSAWPRIRRALGLGACAGLAVGIVIGIITGLVL